MSKILVYLYTTDKRIIPFAIGYMVNPTLRVNKLFIEQVEKYLRATFHQNTMGGMKLLLEKRIIVLLH